MYGHKADMNNNVIDIMHQNLIIQSFSCKIGSSKKNTPIELAIILQNISVDKFWTSGFGNREIWRQIVAMTKLMVLILYLVLPVALWMWWPFLLCSPMSTQSWPSSFYITYASWCLYFLSSFIDIKVFGHLSRWHAALNLFTIPFKTVSRNLCYTPLFN